MGKRHYTCTPWGMPTYNIFGWQKPCYLLQDGYADTFEELMDTTSWASYGTESGNPKCANCMVHSGYEASAVDHTFSSISGSDSPPQKHVLFGGTYENEEAKKALAEAGTGPHLPIVPLTMNGVKRERPSKPEVKNLTANIEL